MCVVVATGDCMCMYEIYETSILYIDRSKLDEQQQSVVREGRERDRTTQKEYVMNEKKRKKALLMTVFA